MQAVFVCVCVHLERRKTLLLFFFLLSLINIPVSSFCARGKKKSERRGENFFFFLTGDTHKSFIQLAVRTGDARFRDQITALTRRLTIISIRDYIFWSIATIHGVRNLRHAVRSFFQKKKLIIKKKISLGSFVFKAKIYIFEGGGRVSGTLL